MIQVSRSDDPVRLGVTGNLTAGGAEKELVAVVEGLVEEGVCELVLDLAAVGIVDSSGLGAMVRAYTTCATAGGWVKLAGVKPQLASVMKIARLDDVFEIVSDGGA
jgi:anti-sigma B factor antagonist